MIEGINSGGLQSVNMFAQSAQNVSLTEDQKNQLQEILSQYDPASMPDDDKKSLMDELKSSGIQPSKEVRSIIEDAGFELGKPPDGPPPPPREGMNTQRPEFIQDAISKYESEGLSEEDINDLISQLKNWGEPPQGILLNQQS